MIYIMKNDYRELSGGTNKGGNGKEPEMRGIYSPNNVHSLEGMFFRNSFW